MAESDRARWDSRWRERGGPGEPSSFLLSLDAELPRQGRALDVAGGPGRHAIWLARRGLEVTLADISEVAHDLARAAAADAGVELSCLATDVQEEPFPAGPWDVIVSFYFLHRPLFEAFPEALAAGGLLVFCQPTLSNLERHARPPRDFLLGDGELPSLLRGLEVVSFEEGWSDEGRHEARLLARKS